MEIRDDENSKLQSDERNRIFTHGIHEETVFYNRLNVFLVCESLLFAGAVSGLSQLSTARSLFIVICLVGLLVSLLWWCAQVSKLLDYKHLITRAKSAAPEFETTINTRVLRGWKQLVRRAGSSTVLAHAFPVLFMIAWSYLLFYMLFGAVTTQACARILHQK